MSDIILDAYYSLGRDLNKAKGTETPETAEGVVGAKLPELELTMGNDELLELSNQYYQLWITSPVYSEWQDQGNDNENYWKGKQHDTPKVDKRRPQVDNVIFQSLETYLPQVTQHDPEPLVVLASSEMQTPEHVAYATELKDELGDIADDAKLRLKLKGVARHHEIYLLGALKHFWNDEEGRPDSRKVRPYKLILDPMATVDEDGYTGQFLGEHRRMVAEDIIDLLGKIGGEEGAKAAIEQLVGTEVGTEIGFIEWWTDRQMWWTLGDVGTGDILLKKKNPHWNYDQKVPMETDAEEGSERAETGGGSPLEAEDGDVEGDEGEQPTTQEPQVDAGGQPMPPQAPQPPVPTRTVPGFNHLTRPRMPYTLLSVYNLGDQPVNATSLIGQNLSSQDIVNKRLVQIDRNADSMNGGMVVSLERSGLSSQQAKGVTEALRKGGTIAIPAGSVNDAIARISAPALPDTIYQQLQDMRGRMQYIFGVHGFTPAQSGGETSAVRSQILNQNLDTARIGGGFAEYLEQVADDTYQYWTQLLYVYDERFSKRDKPKVKITVKEGSMLPKDSAAKAQQAQQLGSAGKMALVDMYKALEYPNAEEMASNVWLEANAPEILFAGDPRVAQAIKMQQQAAQAQQHAEAAKSQPAPTKPSESISFKDLPPEGKAQMAEQAGIHLHAEAIAAHDDVQHQRSLAAPPAPPNQLTPQP